MKVSTGRNTYDNETEAAGEVSGMLSSSTQKYEAYEGNTVTLYCQMCSNLNYYSVNAQSYIWNQVGEAHHIALDRHNTSKISLLAPEANLPVDMLDFLLKVTDDRGVTYIERMEVFIRNTPHFVE